jgi:hypothetical protein
MSLLQAKVQQKSEKISAFGGIFFVLDKLYTGLDDICIFLDDSVRRIGE